MVHVWSPGPILCKGGEEKDDKEESNGLQLIFNIRRIKSDVHLTYFSILSSAATFHRTAFGVDQDNLLSPRPRRPPSSANLSRKTIWAEAEAEAAAAPWQFDGVVVAVFAISAICHTPASERRAQSGNGTFHFLMSHFFLPSPVSSLHPAAAGRGGMRSAQGING